MINTKRYKATLCVLLLCMPMAAYTAESVATDVKETAKDVSKDIQDVSKKVVKAVDKAGDYVSDAAITTQVKAKLAAAEDIPFKISVTTTNGIVHLEGQVDTNLQASKIVELTASVHGVRNVDDSKIEVTSSENYFADAITTAKVKGRLMQLAADDKINSKYDLSVETTNGVVHIFGTVADKPDEKTIKKSVKDIDDVKDVKTNIIVKKPNN